MSRDQLLVSNTGQNVRQEPFIGALRQEIARVLVGQRELVDRMIVCLITGNHLLVEGLPGLAKTLAVTTLADALRADFARIQFTPDLLPADVVGSQTYDPHGQVFVSKEGPVFANILLADEINRAPAKVQSALLEAMQERQVTIGGECRRLPKPFLVMATQNPVEQEGTYALPEAQTDRFMLKVVVSYPTREDERQVLRRMASTTEKPAAHPVATLEEVARAQRSIDEIHIDDAIEEYLLDLVLATRVISGEQDATTLSIRQQGVDLRGLASMVVTGASPRATLMLAQGARALAFIEGRDHVLPRDVKGIAPDVLRHRLGLSYEALAQGMSAGDLVDELLGLIRIP